MSTPIVRKALTDLAREMMQKQQNIIDIIPSLNEVKALLANIPDLLDGYKWGLNLSSQLFDPAKVEIELHIANFMQILPLLEVLEDSGYKITNSWDNAEVGLRVYEGKRIKITTWIRAAEEGEQVCEKVVVGSVPIYGFYCPDSTGEFENASRI